MILIFLILILNSQKFIFYLWNLYFFDLNKKFFSFKIFKIYRTCFWCFFKIFENINISFKYVTIIMSKYSRSISLMMFWHVIDAFVNSNDITKYLYDSYFVWKIIFHLFVTTRVPEATTGQCSWGSEPRLWSRGLVKLRLEHHRNKKVSRNDSKCSSDSRLEQLEHFEHQSNI